MKATIFIQRDNEEFWINLENKSGWVNMVIDALKEEYKKELQYAKNETETTKTKIQDI